MYCIIINIIFKRFGNALHICNPSVITHTQLVLLSPANYWQVFALKQIAYFIWILRIMKYNIKISLFLVYDMSHCMSFIFYIFWLSNILEHLFLHWPCNEG